MEPTTPTEMRGGFSFLVKSIPWGTAIRLLLGAVLFGMACRGFRSAATAGSVDDPTDALQNVGSSLFAGAALIASAICFAPNLAVWAAAPLVRIIDSLYLGGAERVIPPLDFKLARIYAGQGRAHDALDQYRHIVIYHPRAADAYREAIAVALRVGDRSRAKWFYRRARWRLHDRAVCRGLRRELATPRNRAAQPQGGVYSDGFTETTTRR